MSPRALVLRAAGTNCDAEAVHALELAGAGVDRIHINRILEKPALLGDYQILVFPGGFSYGDDIAAGRILANQLAGHLSDVLRRFVEANMAIADLHKTKICFGHNQSAF